MSSQGSPSATPLQVLYILHAVSPFTLWTLALVAVILGMFLDGPAKGTFMESHYAWLRRTFWLGLALLVVLTIIFVLSVVGILLLWALWAGLTIWYL